MLTRRKLSTIGGVCFLFIYLFITTPEYEQVPSVKGYFGKQCTSRKHFGNLTDSHYFLFIKAKYGDDDILSNLFFFLGLKYGKMFAMNIERPMSWYGLSTGEYDSSYLQYTKDPPKILAQELDYDPFSLDKLLGGSYQVSPKVVVGFLRDPYDVFMSCLLKITQNRRRKNQDVSMMLEKNVVDYLNVYETGGHFRSGDVYIGPSTCNNQLAHSLGLNNNLYQEDYNHHIDPSAAERFADLVERRVTNFLIYEKLAKSMFMLTEDYCLKPEQDFLFLSRLPESFVGIGLGTLSDETRKRLEHFLQFDYEIYNRINKKFDQRFANLVKNPVFVENFQVFQDKQEMFNKFCCRSTLSLQNEGMKQRAYGLTESGSRDMRCSMLNGGNMLLSNMVYQIQEFSLNTKVVDLIERGSEFQDFLQIISETLGEEEEDKTGDEVNKDVM